MNATGKSFTVKSSLQFEVDQHDDGVAYTCSVEHVALSNPYMTTEVLEVHCECSNASGKAGLTVGRLNVAKKCVGGPISHSCLRV